MEDKKKWLGVGCLMIQILIKEEIIKEEIGILF